jgi:DUF4097 and DUF4098 domain-containing protein YvlB
MNQEDEIMKNILLVILALCAIGLLAMSKTAHNITKSESITEDTMDGVDNLTLNIQNRNGAIKLVGWDKDYLHYTITKRSNWGKDELDLVDIHVSKNQNSVDFRVEKKEKRARVSIEIVCQVPANLITGAVRTSNGSISVEGCNGTSELSTSNGSITCTSHNGTVEASTSNGSIRLSHLAAARASTSNGKIVITDVPNVLTAKTSNGSIYAEVSSISQDTSFRTSNGSITLAISETIDADISAHTSNSRISIDDLDVRVQSLSRNSFKGSVGSGGPIITASTSNGKIKLRALSQSEKLY